MDNAKELILLWKLNSDQWIVVGGSREVIEGGSGTFFRKDHGDVSPYFWREF